MKTNKPNTRNHTRKHRTTCNEVKFGNDVNNAELRATCKAWLYYCVPRFIVQREGNANNKYFASIFFFLKRSMREMLHRDWFTSDQCGKTIVWGTMDAGINNVIYMELHSGPKMANGTCGNDTSRFHCIYIYIYIYMKNARQEILEEWTKSLRLCITSHILHKWKFVTLFAQKAASSPVPNPWPFFCQRYFSNCYSKGPQCHRQTQTIQTQFTVQSGKWITSVKLQEE